MTLIIAACTGVDLPDKKTDGEAIRALLATNAAAANRRDATGVVEILMETFGLLVIRGFLAWTKSDAMKKSFIAHRVPILGRKNRHDTVPGP